MWVVISGTVRDHKSQLSQKKVTHGLTVVYEAFFLRHILIYFSRSGQNPFGDDEAASHQAALFAFQAGCWLARQERRATSGAVTFM